MRRGSIRQGARQSGFTLIELLIVVSVIGLLIALVLPAVQSARESARKIFCAGNLHQIGLALAQYTSTYQSFPAGQGNLGRSLHVQLLPGLEQTTLFNAINANLDISGSENFSVLQTRLAIFACPSDPCNALGAATNYAGNAGRSYPNVLVARFSGVFNDSEVPAERYIAVSSVSDGLSCTSAMAEWLVGDRARRDRNRDLHIPENSEAGPTGARAFGEACRHLVGFMSDGGGNRRGDLWYSGIWRMTIYDHFLPVNSPSCMNTHHSEIWGTNSASSLHPGGANTLFSDGHLLFIRDSVDPEVWRALGTRDGGEITSSFEP